MAENTGLQFNPLMNLEEGNTQSVPTTASDYFTSQVPQWNPKQLQKAQKFVNWANNTSIEEKEQQFDPLYDLKKWNQGIAGLDKEERDLWEAQNAEKIAGKSDEWIDRLWKNQQYFNVAGAEDFYSHTPEERDKRYEDFLLGVGIKKKYSSNDNINQLMSLTPEGKQELLNSNYKSNYELKAEDEAAEDKDWSDYTIGERWNAINQNMGSYGLSGIGLGTTVGAMFTGVGSIPGAALGGVAGGLTGIIRGITNPEDAKDANAIQRKLNNEDTLHKITVADNDRKKEQASKEITDLQSKYIQAYQQGKISSEDVDSMFDAIALNGKRTTQPDEFGNTEEYNYQGSNYYTMFKDSDEFEHFGTYDKLRYIAQQEVLNHRYGQNSAAQILEQDMQKYVSDNQSGWDWAGNSLKNIWVGGVANLANNVTALGALNARAWYGEEGLANYLKGKDASGNGEDNSFNPQYWNKVDQYNTFDKDAIAKADANGGVSIYNNVVTPGTENDFWSWNTLNEGVRMNKFAWSDLIKNYSLGKLVRGATAAARGVEVAPGVLASESPMLAQVINKVGAVGVMNASSLGIDAAYGMQTYEEVLRQNNEKLDKIIDKDVEDELQRRMQDPRLLQDFRNLVSQENARRQAQAGERGSYVPVDEDKAWDAYIGNIEKEVREQQEAKHAEDRLQAENDAANAYMWDASIEHLRMATTNGVFKSYLFDKGTLNALRGNTPYVATTVGKDGLYALGKHATRNKALATFGTNVWGGFQSNYMDDVTVGFAEGLGIQDYNNYLLQKYNPATYGSVLDDYVNPFIAAMAGANNAMTEKRSFLDGAIGAIGSGLTLMPNIGGILSHRERMKEAKEAAEKNEKKDNVLSWQEMASDFVNNPLLQAFADAKAATRMTEAEINRANNIIKQNGHSFDDMGETLSALNMKAITREGTSMMEAEDAKDKEAFTLATSLLALKNSDVVANAQAEPEKAEWSKKKKIANIIGNGINALFGIPIYESAQSQFTRAMQTLQDAATIGESSDAETQQRQQELVKTFLGLDANKNAIQNMSDAEKQSFAAERLKKNATGLLDMMDKTEKLQKKFEKSIGANMYPEVAKQLMYQYVLDGRWKTRGQEVEDLIRGEENSEITKERNILAQYGSLKGIERAKKAQEKRVADAEKAAEKASKAAQYTNDPNKSIAENARKKASLYAREKAAKRNLKKEQDALKKINADEAILKETLDNKEKSVIAAEEILKLHPDDRMRILDDFYRSDYSEAQQAEIDRAKNLLIADGTSLNEALERVKDSAILQHRIEDNMEAAKRIMQNPTEANMLQNALIENRKRAIVDYFNDKIVAEAFNDFANDPESTISAEKAAIKANNYSTAVLNGMLGTVRKALESERTDEDLSDKTLSIMEDGITKVLNDRDARLKETADLDSFVRKTKKVSHTDVTPEVAGVIEPISGIEIVPFTPERRVTTDRELSQNDKKLLDYAMDYAAERGFSMEEMKDKVDTEDFNTYVQERNHAYQTFINPMTGVPIVNAVTTEQQANPVSPEYMKSLLTDVMDAFKTNQEAVQKAKEEKATTTTPESVVTPPVEAKIEKPKEREEEVRPDEVDASDPLGVKKKKEQPTLQKKEDSRNTQILDEASTLNQRILEDVGVLLDELDKMQMDDRTRDKLKDIISSNLNSKAFTDIKTLQNRVLEEAMIANQADAPMIDAKATVLSGLDIQEVKEKKNGSGETKADAASINNPLQPPSSPTPAILETRDLDALIKYPIWSDFIKKHNVVGFLQKLADVWNREYEEWKKTKKQGYLHQSQVVFIYDPALALQVEQNMTEQDIPYNPEVSAPVLMALEITDKNKSLVEDNSQLISIKDNADGKVKQYQVIGVMPASQSLDSDSQTMKATADRMGSIRNRINFNDKEAHVLRYAPQNNTGKYNGTIIKTNIEKVSSHSEDGVRPEGTVETPKKGVQQLMDENVQSATESFVKVTDEEKTAYDEAKEKGDMPALRKTSLYEKLKNAFIDRLFKREREAANDDKQNTKELNFRVQKGTNNTYPRIVLTKKISETLDRNTGRPIIDLLREVNDEGTNAQEVIESNSRFRRLFTQLSELSIGKGLFDSLGNVVNKTAYKQAITEFEESVAQVINNNLNVDDMSVRVEISDGATSEKTIDINVYSDDINNADNLLATLTTMYNGKLSQAEVASFLKDLILDKEGNTRSGIRYSDFERVKWHVNYEDANTANSKDPSISQKVKDAARRNLGELYDDGILEMQTTKLAYPSRSVTVSINNTMKSKLYPERKVEPETPVPAAVEQKAAFEAETPTGKVDSDTGARTEAPTRESIISAVPRLIMDTINKMIGDSKNRNLTDNGKHYDIGGQIWSRVTSIKYALEGMKERFNLENAWALPSSKIGDSLDDFGRDVFNGVFDSMTDAERTKAFEAYDNSTEKNYADVYTKLKAFEARLRGLGQVIIATGDRENPGHITAKGELNVTVKGQNGIETKRVRVAGTLDVLAVDNQGNLHIYDFKTHKGDFNEEVAKNKGYDRQLSMYAKFLEDEYGLKVKSINIIPVKAEYPTPSGIDNEGNAIKGAQKTYREQRPNSNQLEIKDITADDSKYEEFKGANFQVEKEMPLTRLSDEQLVADFDNMTDAEKEAIVEAIQDQSDNPNTEIKNADDIVTSKPEIDESTQDDEEGGFSRRGKLGRRSNAKSAPVTEETLDSINPQDPNGLLARMKDLKNSCGGKV